MGELYVEVNKETGDDYCRMTVYSAITLFVYQFCQVYERFTLHFVTVRLSQSSSLHIAAYMV